MLRVDGPQWAPYKPPPGARLVPSTPCGSIATEFARDVDTMGTPEAIVTRMKEVCVRVE